VQPKRVGEPALDHDCSRADTLAVGDQRLVDRGECAIASLGLDGKVDPWRLQGDERGPKRPGCADNARGMDERAN